MPKYSGLRSPATHCWWWPIASTGTVEAAAPASSQSSWSATRCPVRGRRDRRVEQGDRHAGQLDPLVAGVLVLAPVGVVVAAHDVQAIAERRAVARLEGGELLRRAVVVRSPLTMTAARSAAAISADGRPVHRLRVRRRAGRGAQDRPVRVVVDAAGLDLAEVDVVDRAEAAAQRPGGRSSVRNVMPWCS